MSVYYTTTSVYYHITGRIKLCCRNKRLYKFTKKRVYVGYKIYKQTYETTMRSPVSTVIANLVTLNKNAEFY